MIFLFLATHLYKIKHLTVTGVVMEEISLFYIFSEEGAWFWVMCQSLVVTITLVFILRQLKIQGSAHLVNSITVLDNRWKSQIMLKARRLTCEKYRPDRTSVDQATAQICYFFEEIGIYCKRSILDLETVWEIYSYDIEHYWMITKNGIHHLRKKKNDPTYYKNFQNLYNTFAKIQEGGRPQW